MRGEEESKRKVSLPNFSLRTSAATLRLCGERAEQGWRFRSQTPLPHKHCLTSVTKLNACPKHPAIEKPE
jgi:hypothetical protein